MMEKTSSQPAVPKCGKGRKEKSQPQQSDPATSNQPKYHAGWSGTGAHAVLNLAHAIKPTMPPERYCEPAYEKPQKRTCTRRHSQPTLTVFVSERFFITISCGSFYIVPNSLGRGAENPN